MELKVYTDYNTQIQADFIGKTAPDVFYIDASMFPFYSSLGVMDVLDPEEYSLGEFYPNLVEAFTDADGNVQCVPKDASTLATYYNIDLLESVGFTAEDIPGDYAEYKAFLTDLQARLDEKYGPNQIAAMTYNQDLSRNLYILQDGTDGLIDAEGKPVLTGDRVVSNMDFILDLVHAGVWKTPSDLGLGWNGEAFGTGKTVIMEEGNWVYGTLKVDYSDIHFGVKEMPVYNGTQYSMSYTVGYGMTECGPAIAFDHWQTFRPTSCGRAVDRMEIRIDSPDPFKQVGEIRTKGMNVMDGYYNNPEASNTVLSPDGWLHTGDLGVLDPDGYLYIKGRSKSLILGPSGQNIYPEEIEDLLNAQPYIAESLVIEREGKLVALVYPDAEAMKQNKISREALLKIIHETRKQINQQIPAYSQIARIEIHDEEFEKTPKRSIKRFLYQ